PPPHAKAPAEFGSFICCEPGTPFLDCSRGRMKLPLLQRMLMPCPLPLTPIGAHHTGFASQSTILPGAIHGMSFWKGVAAGRATVFIGSVLMRWNGLSLKQSETRRKFPQTG